SGAWAKPAVARRRRVGGRTARAGRRAAARGARARCGTRGLARSGRATPRGAAGCGMETAYTNRKPRGDVSYRFVASPVDLARESDILIVAASAGPDARNMVNRAVIEALGPDGLLVNVARGAVVDEPELVAALTDGRLGGAALDVFANEPHAPEALFGLDNVVLQPHQASATIETRMAMGNLVLANLSAFFAGQPLPTAVV
ncbi:2-hydroxyacid dehydrogenase, partial [Azospirillum brasilense]|nr:2-hydroxyacid dehydrogenase [Azospirillum brasilense]